jgi:GAF domain-containing protein
MVRVRNPSTAALQRIQMRRLRYELETKAARDSIVSRDRQDDAIQELFGIGLAMQITTREASPVTAVRMTDHIAQLQGVISDFRADIVDVPPGPVDVPPWRTAFREMVTDIGANRPRPTTLRLSGPVEGWRTRSPAARARRARPSTAMGSTDELPRGTSTEPLRETRLAEAFITLTDRLVAHFDLVELLHYLVEISVELLDVAAAGLVLANSAGQLNVMASTSAPVELLESLQISTDAGPCVECYTTGEVQSITDVTGRVERWPQFAPLALQAGFRSVHAVPMRLGERVIGALNLFRTQPGRLAESDRRSAQALADVATVGILQVLAAGETAAVNRKLEDALASRDVIEQAKGMLAHSAGLEMDEAFLALRDMARHNGIPLTAVARAMVDGARGPVAVPRASVPIQRPATD